MWLTDDKTPTNCGLPGTWQEQHFSILIGTTPFALDVKDGNTKANGATIQLWERNFTPAQTWRLYCKEHEGIKLFVRVA